MATKVNTGLPALPERGHNLGMSTWIKAVVKKPIPDKAEGVTHIWGDRSGMQRAFSMDAVVFVQREDPFELLGQTYPEAWYVVGAGRCVRRFTTEAVKEFLRAVRCGGKVAPVSEADAKQADEVVAYVAFQRSR